MPAAGPAGLRADSLLLYLPLDYALAISFLVESRMLSETAAESCFALSPTDVIMSVFSYVDLNFLY